MNNHKAFLPRSKFLRSLPKKRISASVMLFNARGSLLMVKPWYKQYWTLPGGSVDAWESPSEACRREVWEEVGIRLRSVRLLAVFYDNRRSKRDEIIHFVFLGGRVSSTIKTQRKSADGEIEEVRFVPRNRIGAFASPKFSRRIRTLLDSVRGKRIVYFEAAER